MNAQELLNVIGQAQEEYILQAIDTRNRKKPLPLSRRLLIAAIIGILLLLTACGATYVSGLLASYFQKVQGSSLSDSQLTYIESNTQPVMAHSLWRENEYSIQVESALTDGKVAYLTVKIRGPEGVSLEDGQIRFLQQPRLYPETEVPGLILDRDGASPCAMGNYLTVEDGDGLANTAAIVFSVNPPTQNHQAKPFDGSVKWRVQFGGFEKVEYPGQGKPPVEIPLTEGDWIFALTFRKTDAGELRFVETPVPVRTSDERQKVYEKENQMESFLLSSLTYKLILAEPEIDQKVQELEEITIVMQDGTCQTIPRPSAYANRLPVPIALEEVAYLLLTDGTKLYPVNE